MNTQMMSAKEYLAQAQHIDKRISCKLELVFALRTLATSATMTISDMPRSDSPDLQPMSEIVAKIVDLESSINDDIDMLVDLKREYISVIRAVPNPEHQMLLELRYLCFKTWTEIAERLSFDGRYVYKLHVKALASVEPLIPAEARERLVWCSEE